MATTYDPAMYKKFLKGILLIEKDCIKHLKNRYIVRQRFYTEQYHEVRVGTTDNPTIISLYELDGKLYYEYEFTNGLGVKSMETSIVHNKCVDFVPDGYMDKCIQIIKDYSRHRLRLTYPEITLLPNKRYSVHLWI